MERMQVTRRGKDMMKGISNATAFFNSKFIVIVAVVDGVQG